MNHLAIDHALITEKTGRLRNPWEAADLVHYLYDISARHGTWALTPRILGALQEVMFAQYRAMASDPLGVYGVEHQDDYLERLDATYALRCDRWTFEDFLSMPEYRWALAYLRSGLEYEDTLPLIESATLRVRVANAIGRGATSVHDNLDFGPDRYRMPSVGGHPLRDVPLFWEYSTELGVGTPSLREAQEDLQGLTDYCAWRTGMRSLVHAHPEFLGEDRALPSLHPFSSHLACWGELRMFTRHTRSPDGKDFRLTYVADPLGRPVTARGGLGDYVYALRETMPEEVVGAPSTVASALSGRGRYRDLLAAEPVLPINRLMVCVEDRPPRALPALASFASEAQEAQESSVAEARYHDVSTPYLARKAAQALGIETGDHLISHARNRARGFRLTSLGEEFGATHEPWQPVPLLPVPGDGWVHAAKLSTTYRHLTAIPPREAP